MRKKTKRTQEQASRRMKRVVRALAIELWKAGVAEVRLSEGWNDGKTWRDTSERTKTGMMGIAKYIQNWKRPNDQAHAPRI